MIALFICIYEIGFIPEAYLTCILYIQVYITDCLIESLSVII